MKRLAALHPSINLDQFGEIADQAGSVIDRVRDKMLSPDARKRPPVFTAVQIANLCNVDKVKIAYTAKKGKLPTGTKNGQRLEWTLAETREWARHLRSDSLRDPELAAAVVIAVANLKGGVGKTTTTLCLAQRLSLLGHRVLCIDLDSQGSLTHLFGILPDTEVSPENTVLPLCSGKTNSLRSAIQTTYWDGIDLIAAGQCLYNLEFLMPSRQRNEENFEFWRVLERGLDDCMSDYDVILLDTPPSMSYTTVMGLSAAQGLVVPLPPSALDFASTQQFFSIASEVLTGLYRSNNTEKSFSFINVLINKPDKDAISSSVRQWITASFGGMVLPVEIPKTSAASTATAAQGTAYDLDSSVNPKTLKRALDEYDKLGDFIEGQMLSVWSADAELTESTRSMR
jgi:chromosome partitioning protein